jgi:hypothetical protein
MLLPALAAAKQKALAAQCVSNLKQLQLGWVVYAGDFSDSMMPNSPSGYSTSPSWIGDTSVESWDNNDANTNATLYQTNLMAGYMTGQLGVYRCPADNVPSDNGQRIRTYSMQGQVGGKGPIYMNQANAKFYTKTAQITGFPGSQMDGWLQVDNDFGSTAGSYNSSAGYFPDVPGAYHKWSCGMSFADGHSEIHKWLNSTLKIPVTAHMSPPGGYTTGTGLPAGNVNGSTATDWQWFTSRCAAHN